MPRWITREDYEKIEPGDKLEVRYMRGIAKVIARPVEDTVRVIFLGGPWRDRELELIQQQIKKIL